ncbi:MAG: thiamine pyrophosphate-binding protein, partial [Butyrivibrio sp.]
MNVSEYIVEFLEEKGIRDFFGYQGTMIAYFIEAVCGNPNVRNHSCYNEQGAAFAAVGYAKAGGGGAVAYATSGPGALNLISGIADAYYDSVPVIFITGQLNTTEYTDIPKLRQQGFQQTDVVSITAPITKYSVMIDDVSKVEEELNKAWEIANSGRKGPVVLDIPMNIQKSVMPDICNKMKQKINHIETDFSFINDIYRVLNESRRPVLMLGNGIARSNTASVRQLVNKLNIPVVTSMPGIDLLESDDVHNLGYLGAAYGFRAANIVACKKADLIISLGSSMCRRQTGNPGKFAEKAGIIRVDLDKTELQRKVHEDEISYEADVNELIHRMLEADYTAPDRSQWLRVCSICRQKTEEFNDSLSERKPNEIIKNIGRLAVADSVFAIDVGQHQIWAAQSLPVVSDRRIIFSGGHGAMGFSLPAAIGAYYATGVKTYCIAGDGAFQMNIQELQWVVREQIPVTIFVMNNNSLGLIRQQQDDFFGS